MSVVMAALWALIATVVAFLPMRFQVLPGILLLAAAPITIGMLGAQHGWFMALAGALAVISMFRKPLHYYLRKWKGVSQ